MPIGKWRIYKNKVKFRLFISSVLFNIFILTLLLFSNEADFCYDYSVWKFPNGSNKHECYESGPIGASWYNELRNCKLHPLNVTKEDCDEKGNDFFYCQHSQICIGSNYICDGVSIVLKVKIHEFFLGIYS